MLKPKFFHSTSFLPHTLAVGLMKALSWLRLSMGLLLISGCGGWVIVPSFNERRVGVQLREAVRFRHEPVQNWCQVSLNEESEVVTEEYATDVRKTEAKLPNLLKLSKMGKNVLLSAGLMCATCMARAGHVLAQDSSALAGHVLAQDGSALAAHFDDDPEELGTPIMSEEFWGESSALQQEQPVVSKKSDMDTTGSSTTADFDVGTEEVGVVIDESSTDGAKGQAITALVDKMKPLQQASRRSLSGISLKSHVIGPIGAVIVSSGIGAYIVAKRRRRILKAMPTATVSTGPAIISTSTLKPHEREGSADLDLELLDADPVPRQYSPAAPDISSLDDFIPGKPIVDNEVPENESNANGHGLGGAPMSRKTSNTAGKPPVAASFSPPQMSESKNNNLGFGSLFKRDKGKRPVSLRDALSKREENKSLHAFLFAVASELSSVAPDDGVFGIPLASSSNQGTNAIRELKEASRLTVKDSADELTNIVNAMVVALVDVSVERLKERNDGQAFEALETLVKFMDKAANLFEELCPDTSVEPPIRYNGGARKKKLEDLYRCYASRTMKGLSVPTGLDRLQDLFMIKESKVNSITQKLLMDNMMKMMSSDGGSGEDGAAAAAASSPELSGLMEAMGGIGGQEGGTGVLPHGKDPFGDVGSLDPKAITAQIDEFRRIVQQGALSKADVVNLRKSYKDMGLDIDEMLDLAKMNQSGMSPELKELFSLLETVLSKYPR